MRERERNDRQRGKRWNHFSHEAPEALTPTPTFSETLSERGREQERVEGEAEAKKSGVMPNFLTRTERGKRMKGTEKVGKKDPRE